MENIIYFKNKNDIINKFFTRVNCLMSYTNILTYLWHKSYTNMLTYLCHKSWVLTSYKLLVIIIKK